MSIAAEAPATGEFDAILLPAERLHDSEHIRRLQGRGAWVIGYGRPEHLRAAFLAGCEEYLKDPWNVVELACRLERLRGVGAAAGVAPEAAAGGDPGSGRGAGAARGPSAGSAASPHAFAWGALRLESLAVCSGAECRPLSLPEYRILAALLRHRGQVVPRTVLYYAIWSKAPEGRSRVVDVHVSSLRRKLLELCPDSRGCLRCLRGSGYALV